ncbi:polysaccharide deacetylase family protein [Sporichthya polymorpha]|uniref:polysaccharide deacetylase family protein n=1 Tax=Sporichthya polymorpha TaxID=35751 RepID=UPI00037F81F9|nr:polysaccharide deacetylase family protein [Sporichthya polymorpha]
MARGTRAAAFVLGLALLGACGGGDDSRAAEPSPTPSPATRVPATRVPAAGGIDELGQIPILMYHQIRPEARAPSDRTPAQFRADLRRLHAEGYRPVTAADYVAGNIDLPVGTHPVVLTFDDSSAGQAQIGPDGEPEPNTALGILEAFGRAHPDFRPTATFFVVTNRIPFNDPDVLPWLAANGYEIGAHTQSHPELQHLDDLAVQEQIGANLADIDAAVPGYQVRTFATPYGHLPRNPELAWRGSYNGVPYEFAAVFGTGRTAALSPFATAFDPYAIPRLAAGLSAAEAVLAELRRRPELRYTSDGDPDRVSGGRRASA